MSKKRYTLIALGYFCLLVAAFCLGRWAFPDSHLNTYTFYAVVEQADGSSYTVRGLDVNNADHRGDFCFTVDEDTVLSHNFDRNLSLSAFAEGDLVAITYRGSRAQGELTVLSEVLLLDLLDDIVYRPEGK